MTRTLNILCLISLLIVGSCFEPPQFSIFPKINVEAVRGKEVPGNLTADSLVVTVKFQDGDGNIGIGPNENKPPFHERWFFLINPISACDPGVSAPCKKISFVDAANLKNYVSYKLRKTPAYDTLPEFKQPFDCFKYYVVTNESNNKAIDTLYSELNNRYSNFFMEILVKNGADFEVFDFRKFPYPNCEIYGLDGRLPILAKDKDLSLSLPLEGIISYKAASPAFYKDLRNKTLKVRVQLMDRDGNMSNIDESNEFILK